jgi:hypothetical protein
MSPTSVQWQVTGANPVACQEAMGGKAEPVWRPAAYLYLQVVSN